MTGSDQRVWTELRDAEPRARAASLAWVVSQLDEEPRQQRLALELLGYWSEMRRERVSSDVAQKVLTLANANDAVVRKEACATLAMLRTREPLPEREASLIRRMSDDAASVRQEAAAALGDLRVHRAQPELVAALSDPDEGVRFESAFALSNLGAEEARVVLEGALGDPQHRAYAIEGLRRLGHPESMEPLRRLSRRWWLAWPDRMAAQAALASMGDAEARRTLEASTHRGRFEVRAYALYLLGHAGCAESHDLLLAHADQPAPLRATAVQALGKLGVAADDGRFQAWATDRTLPDDVRLEALETLAPRLGPAQLGRLHTAGAFSDLPELDGRARELSEG